MTIYNITDVYQIGNATDSLRSNGLLYLLNYNFV
jgi:hypothetical protein